MVISLSHFVYANRLIKEKSEMGVFFFFFLSACWILKTSFLLRKIWIGFCMMIKTFVSVNAIIVQVELQQVC